tara:strand:- start:40 stop:366 length:327 start_codon:yes stop_codon:yes gene_type:complete
MHIQTIKRKIEKESNKFIKLQTYRFKDCDGSCQYEGYITIGDVEGRKIGRRRASPTGNTRNFSVYDCSSAEMARIRVLTIVADHLDISKEIQGALEDAHTSEYYNPAY